ncbi:LPP20 family lipoprotein [Natronoflexus pectinivorans]|uniref:LPP20 lipoprotein n=1 Tax=Natronoflexus pectinivorans TaxID=682526 RepID=A0A4V2RWY6_9BACT|nr:LPP20 family lipoprotein [Natronoflexus pectinivorans]TCO10761.1 LPP20 lipoprotein [Natronoflexus pectinivorans]
MYRILLLIGIFLFSLNTFTAESQRRPSWVRQRPSDSDSYIGIGMAPKSRDDQNMQYARDARNQALEELSSEIKVTISANSMLRQFENNFQFQQQFESKVHTSVQQTLEGYEVHTWENRREYWVMVRLNKNVYAQRRQQRLDMAKMLASSYFFDARDATAVGDVSRALTSYFRAVTALQDHVGEDLTHRTANGTVNYSTDIMSDLRRLYRNISFTPVNNHLRVEFSRQMQEPMALKAEYFSNGDILPVANLPVKFEFSHGEGVLNSQSVTSNNGEIQSTINRLISRRKMQEVTACLDLATIIRDEDLESPLLPYFFPSEDLPCTRFTIELNKSTAFCRIEENLFGNLDPVHSFGNLIRADLNENFFNFSMDAADAEYIVNLSLNFRKGDERVGTGYSVFLVYADLHISVVSVHNGTKIFSDGFMEVRGMRPGSYQHALNEARENVLDRFRREILPKLDEVDM